MNITVYLGANEGNDPSLKTAVRELGTWIGESGNRLVYGGSKSGLMGEIAESVLQAGGEVTGVEPQFLLIWNTSMMPYRADRHEGHDGAQDEDDRAGGCFHCVPRGTGTTGRDRGGDVQGVAQALGSPCILYDLDGYYTGLRMLLDHMIELGLSSKERQKGICFAKDLPEIQKILQSSL